MIIQFKKLHPDARPPLKGTVDAAGFDLSSITQVFLNPRDRAKVPTGIAVAIPRGYFGLVRPRSGSATKHGINLSTSGVVDADYRGELFVTLMNHSNEPYTIVTGERIAQMMILPVPEVILEEVYELDETIRGDGGFGSTGKI